MKNKRFIQILAFVAVLLATSLVGYKIIRTKPPASTDEHGHGHGEHEEEVVKGPKGGRLLGDKNFQVEITIEEPPGREPAFRAYFYTDGKPLDPTGIDLTVELHRLNRIDLITFAREGRFLVGEQPVVEPHSFDAKVEVERGGKTYKWAFQNLEGRVEISEESRRKSGITIESAGPARLSVKLELNGKIAANEEQMTHIFPRFPGVVKSVRKKLGDRVAKGEVLATIESNESLRTYDITSELAGTVIKKNLTLGEIVSGQEPIFTIADLSTVWADFSVYRQDFPLLREGQTVVLEGGPGTETVEAKIDYISPFGSENSQTMLARAVVPNSKGVWRPGLFVRGSVIVDQAEVPVAVKASALQSLRGSNVVFLAVGDFLEATPVKTGRRDGEWVEIISGLKPGEKYAGENSFIVKADIGKAGAEHEH